MKQRLDHYLVSESLVRSRSQAESYIKLEQVSVNGKVITKNGFMVPDGAKVILKAEEQYVSRAALKLKSVAGILRIDFKGKTMLDVGSSTGGFTEFALKSGVQKVFAVDVGKDQLHPSLHGNPQIELHEQTDIRDFKTNTEINLVVMDVSFISLREILPHVATLCNPKTEIIAMVKPQFEARNSNVMHKGVIKNDRMRRDILKDFEMWAGQHFLIVDKADSQVAGSKGNVERFYKLRLLRDTQKEKSSRRQ